MGWTSKRVISHIGSGELGNSSTFAGINFHKGGGRGGIIGGKGGPRQSREKYKRMKLHTQEMGPQEEKAMIQVHPRKPYSAGGRGLERIDERTVTPRDPKMRHKA